MIDTTQVSLGSASQALEPAPRAAGGQPEGPPGLSGRAAAQVVGPGLPPPVPAAPAAAVRPGQPRTRPSAWGPHNPPPAIGHGAHFPVRPDDRRLGPVIRREKRRAELAGTVPRAFLGPKGRLSPGQEAALEAVLDLDLLIEGLRAKCRATGSLTRAGELKPAAHQLARAHAQRVELLAQLGSGR